MAKVRRCAPSSSTAYSQRNLRTSLDNGAVIGDRLSRAHSSVDQSSVAKTRVDGHIDAVEDFGLISKIRCRLDQVTGRHGELGRAHVIEAANLPAARLAEQRVGRQRHTVRVEIGWCQSLIRSDLEITVPGAIVADVESHARAELVLQRQPTLPRVRTLGPARSG